MEKRIALVFIGLLLIAGVVYLGFLSISNSSLVVWFGIASAIAAPAGLAAIGSAFKPNNNELLERLSKVPEIEKLIVAAKTQEEKIRALEQEREKLTELVQFESLRQSLLTRKDSLEQDCVKSLESLDAVEDKLSQLDIRVNESGLSQQVQALRDRIQYQGRDYIPFYFAGQRHIFNVKKLRTNPFGEVIVGYIVLFQELSRLIRRLFFRRA